MTKATGSLGHRKLTEEQVRRIRDTAKDENGLGISHRAMAREMGVTPHTIRAIRNRQVYKMLK